MYFEWKEKYSVNVAEIDKQHKKLFEIGGQVADLVLAKDDHDHYDEIMVILQELKDYTIYHFGYEEKVMEKYGYQGLESHKIEHIFLIKKLNRIQNKDIGKKEKEAIVELIAFISDWIAGHILRTDMGYKECFNKKGIY